MSDRHDLLSTRKDDPDWKKQVHHVLQDDSRAVHEGMDPLCADGPDKRLTEDAPIQGL